MRILMDKTAGEKLKEELARLVRMDISDRYRVYESLAKVGLVVKVTIRMVGGTMTEVIELLSPAEVDDGKE